MKISLGWKALPAVISRKRTKFVLAIGTCVKRPCWTKTSGNLTTGCGRSHWTKPPIIFHHYSIILSSWIPRTTKPLVPRYESLFVKMCCEEKYVQKCFMYIWRHKRITPISSLLQLPPKLGSTSTGCQYLPQIYQVLKSFEWRKTKSLLEPNIQHCLLDQAHDHQNGQSTQLGTQICILSKWSWCVSCFLCQALGRSGMSSRQDQATCHEEIVLD